MSCCQPASHGRPYLVFLFPLVILALALTSWLLEPGTASGRSAPDSSQVVATVTEFHQALEAGDGDGAIALLSPDAVIAENGDVETRAEYASHHLEADMAFARAVDRKAELIQVVVTESSAWITSETETRGTYRGRGVESRGVETVVLRKRDEGWRISAIHWSSRDG